MFTDVQGFINSCPHICLQMWKLLLIDWMLSVVLRDVDHHVIKCLQMLRVMLKDVYRC